MGMNGFCILDSDFNIHSYNHHLLNLLEIEPGKTVDLTIMRIFKDNHPLYNLIKAVGNNDTLETEGDFNIKLPQQKQRSYHIQISNTPYYKKESLTLVMVSEPEERDLNAVHLNRSLKYNVITKLAGSLAHEVRNPLSSLAIHTEILDNTLSNISLLPDKTARIKKSIDIVRSERERVIHLIELFFKLARSGNNEATYEDINSILREVYELIRQHCYELGHQVEMDLEDDIPFVHINRDRLIEVLLNIVINALEAMEKGGKLTIRSQKIGTRGCIYIEDRGSGIPENIRKNIFNQFVTSKKTGGGASLVLARKIVEEMGGRISFSSKNGSGTAFVIELEKAHKF